MVSFLMLSSDEVSKKKIMKIYSIYGSLMLYISSNILNNAELAQDAVSESIIRIIANIDKIDDVESNKTKGFITIIVRNISLNILKRKNPTVSLDEYVDYSQNEDPVFEIIHLNEMQKKFDDALSKLNKNYSDVLVLSIKYDFSNKEIADILGISNDNVKVRLSRAKKALRTLLLKEGSLL